MHHQSIGVSFPKTRGRKQGSFRPVRNFGGVESVAEATFSILTATQWKRMVWYDADDCTMSMR